VGIGPDQTLQALPNGTVAVRDSANAPAGNDAALQGDALGGTLTPAPPEATPDVFTEPALLASADLTAISPTDDQASEGGATALPLEPITAANAPSPTDPGLALAPTSADAAPNTILSVLAPLLGSVASLLNALVPPIGPDIQAQYADELNVFGEATNVTQQSSVAVISPRGAQDAAGNSITAPLTVVNGNTVVMTVPHDASTVYPVVASLRLSTQAGAVIAAAVHRPRYGFSDQRPATFAPFDPKLKGAPLNVGTARKIVPFDISPTDPDLTAWLTNVENEKLAPFIVLGPRTFCSRNVNVPCAKTSVADYAAHFATLVNGLEATRATHPILYWGAWNEPNFPENPTRRDPELAAKYWAAAQSALNAYRQAHAGTPRLFAIAGEFDGAKFADQRGTIRRYKAEIKLLRRQNVVREFPSVWSLHAYNDLVQVGSLANPVLPGGQAANPTTSQFVQFLSHGDVGSPRFWLSEQGVQLTGQRPTSADPIPATRLNGRPDLQRLSALDVLRLASTPGTRGRVDRVYYYLYNAPPPNVPDTFDSALVTADKKSRPAYCVLAFSNHPRTCKGPGDSTPPIIT